MSLKTSSVASHGDSGSLQTVRAERLKLEEERDALAAECAKLEAKKANLFYSTLY